MRRASSLPFARHCGHASVLAEAHPETSAFADDGRATHEEIRRGIMGEAEPTSAPAIAAVAFVRKLIAELSVDLRDVFTEGEILLLDDAEHDFAPLATGHCDLAIATKGIVHIFDWKRSRWGNVEEPDTNPQLIAYGLALVQEGERPFQVHLVFGDDADECGNARPRSSRVFTMADRPALLAMIRDLATKSDDPCVGNHCASCYVSQYCDAYRSRVTSALAVLDRQTDVMDQPTAEALDTRLMLAEQWIEWAKLVRLAYLKAGGVLTRDGKQAAITTCNGRESADCKALRADGLSKYITTGKPYDRITWRKIKE